METLSLELDYSSPTTTSTTTTTTKTIKNMTKHSNGSIAIIETFESNQDEKLDGHPKYHHETTKTIIKNNTTSQLIINDDNKNDNDNNDDNNDYEDVNVVVVDNTKSATINNKHQQDNDTISILATINNNTLMSPSMTTSTNIRKKENTNKNFTIMIDDLFIRKLLHQICPQIFDENWLERFTQQYLQSFHEKKCTLRVREILDLTLSSNSMTAVDEIFVYWPIHHQSTNNIDDENDNDQEIYIDSSSTWLQYRDAMTYLYNFCELLMSIEAKFVHAKQKDMCQQLAREIRSYLYWITNDDRFKVCGSNDNEEESPPLFQSSPVDLIGGNIDNHPKPQRKQEEMSSNVISHNYNDSYNNCQQQHKLFHSILQHLLRILYEILMKLNQSDDHVNSISNQNNDMVVNNSLKFFQIFNKLFERFESSSTDHTSLYNQWMRQLNSLLMMLMKYAMF
uniref:Peroxisomal biogenesis factor 6-like n=1 Tax=Dermatophagoides pteronyssinus TaxID=6956 RepID=A0A6P6XRJ8_DERPT|nr:peroxisomal biogenesis factor 6-like [Dermatophagoides pteronyssinus]